MKVNKKFIFRNYKVPECTIKAIQRFEDYGIKPGSFLVSVMLDKLGSSIFLADEENLKNLPAIVNYFYNYVPINCIGTIENINNWKGYANRSKK